MYALVEINGHQFKAEKGAVLQVDRLAAEKGTTLEFDSVLLVSDKDVSIGKPYIQGAKVKVLVEKEIRGNKTIFYRYKRRKSWHRTVGNRPFYTLLKVEDIIV